MQSRVDELTSDTHMRMTFIEFIEAMSRAAEYLSLAPPSGKTRDLYLREIYGDSFAKEQTDKMKEEEEKLEQQLRDDDFRPFEDIDDSEYDSLTKEEQVNQPLHKKIENIIPYLLAYCTSKGFKKKWKWPVETT